MTCDDRPTFDLDQIPFSRAGSWLDVSPVVGLHRTSPDLHLVSHVTTMTAALALVPVHAGERAACEVTGTPTVLTWTHAAGRVDAVFETTDTVRLRGTGLGLRVTAADGRLTPFTGPFLVEDPVDGAAVFTLYETGRRYRVSVIRGTVALTGAGRVGEVEREVRVGAADAGNPDGDWEIAVEEFETARGAYRATTSFDEVVTAVGSEFDAFLAAVAPWRDAVTPAAALAAYVVWSATVRPGGFVRRDAVLMSKHWMDSVWSWDHCFNALAAVGSPALAWDQLQVPFDHQDPSGALPDSVTHSRVLYNYVKPPVHGWMYDELLAAGLPTPTGAERERWYERLSAWSRFWLDRRRVPGHALPYYQHGNDSGWDNATSFDVSTVVEAPDLAAFLTLQLQTLATLATDLGRDAEAADWRRQATVLLDALVEQLWDGERFVVRDAVTGEARASRSLLGVLPVVLGDLLPRAITDRLAATAEQHLTEHGLATEPVDSPRYEDDGYWRGPIWAPSTFIVENGLRRAGHTRLADVVGERFRALCERSGFAENFDARTGAGLRDRAYTWTAAVYLVLARDHVRRSATSGPGGSRRTAELAPSALA